MLQNLFLATGVRTGLAEPSSAAPVQALSVDRVVCDRADMTACDAIAWFLDRCARIIGDRPHALQIDLRIVQHVDTKFMASLVAVYQLARRSSVRIELRASQSVLELMEFCKLRAMLGELTSAA
jgi:ABC-type transporter Mla MlaB component